MDSTQPTHELTERFMKGLKEYGLSYDDIKNNDWKYCGGNRGCHLNYFKLFWKHDKIPKLDTECVCGHAIEENCYITDGTQILILGNICIKKFVPKSSRTCEICGETHRNRKVNKCNSGNLK